MSNMKNIIIDLHEALTDLDAYEGDKYGRVYPLEAVAEAAANLMDALVAPQERCNEGNQPTRHSTHQPPELCLRGSFELHAWLLGDGQSHEGSAAQGEKDRDGGRGQGAVAH